MSNVWSVLANVCFFCTTLPVVLHSSGDASVISVLIKPVYFLLLVWHQLHCFWVLHFSIQYLSSVIQHIHVYLLRVKKTSFWNYTYWLTVRCVRCQAVIASVWASVLLLCSCSWVVLKSATHSQHWWLMPTLLAIIFWRDWLTRWAMTDVCLTAVGGFGWFYFLPMSSFCHSFIAVIRNDFCICLLKHFSPLTVLSLYLGKFVIFDIILVLTILSCKMKTHLGVVEKFVTDLCTSRQCWPVYRRL